MSLFLAAQNLTGPIGSKEAGATANKIQEAAAS